MTAKLIVDDDPLVRGLLVRVFWDEWLHSARRSRRGRRIAAPEPKPSADRSARHRLRDARTAGNEIWSITSPSPERRRAGADVQRFCTRGSRATAAHRRRLLAEAILFRVATQSRERRASQGARLGALGLTTPALRAGSSSVGEWGVGLRPVWDSQRCYSPVSRQAAISSTRRHRGADLWNPSARMTELTPEHAEQIRAREVRGWRAAELAWSAICARRKAS